MSLQWSPRIIDELKDILVHAIIGLHSLSVNVMLAPF